MIPLGFVSMIYDVIIANIVPCKFTSLSISSPGKTRQFLYLRLKKLFYSKLCRIVDLLKKMLRQGEDDHNHSWFRLSNLGGCIAVNWRTFDH